MEWLTRVDDRVTSVAPRVDVIKPSPDGLLLAVFLTRASDPDLVRRERVYVIERATGREVVALVGPEILRAFAWVGNDCLLVVRDHARRGAWVRAHAIPDGGVERELLLDDTPDGICFVSVSADFARALITPSQPRDGAPYAWVVALPSLTLTTRITPLETERTNYADFVLHPEGARVLCVGFDDLRVIALDDSARGVRSPPLPRGFSLGEIAWLSRDRALALPSEWAEEGAAPFVFDLSTGAVSAIPDLDGLQCTDVHVDADRGRVALVTQPSGESSPLLASLRVLDAATTVTRSSREWLPFPPWRVRVRWASDEAVVTAARTRTHVLLARWSPDDGPPVRFTSVTARGDGEDFLLWTVHRDVVLVAQFDDAGAVFADLVDVSA